jgi:hypothetical protein
MNNNFLLFLLQLQTLSYLPLGFTRSLLGMSLLPAEVIHDIHCCRRRTGTVKNNGVSVRILYLCIASTVIKGVPH